MKKMFVFMLFLLLICCKKDNRVVEYNTENIPEVNNKEISLPQSLQRNIPKEEIIFNEKLDILNRIHECIVEANFENAKAIINNIDINKYIGGLYILLRKDGIKTEEKVELIKYLTNGEISNPYILIYLSPNEYDIFINEFSLNVNDIVDEFGRNILHHAVMMNNTELLDYLLKKNIKINALDNNDHNALFYSLEFYPIDWYDPVTENENHVSINWANSYFYGEPYYSRNILNKEDRTLYVITKLLRSGININQKTKYGWTILHFSVFLTTEYIYDLFLSYNADENSLTKYGRTPKDLLIYKN